MVCYHGDILCTPYLSISNRIFIDFYVDSRLWHRVWLLIETNKLLQDDLFIHTHAGGLL